MVSILGFLAYHIEISEAIYTYTYISRTVAVIQGP